MWVDRRRDVTSADRQLGSLLDLLASPRLYPARSPTLTSVGGAGPNSPTSSAAARTSRRLASMRRRSVRGVPDSLIVGTSGHGKQFAAADLGDQAGCVEVDALVDDPVAIEEEHRDERNAERLAGWRKTVELAEIRSQ